MSIKHKLVEKFIEDINEELINEGLTTIKVVESYSDHRYLLTCPFSTFHGWTYKTFQRYKDSKTDMVTATEAEMERGKITSIKQNSLFFIRALGNTPRNKPFAFFEIDLVEPYQPFNQPQNINESIVVKSDDLKKFGRVVAKVM